jgi:hypothetical protein
LADGAAAPEIEGTVASLLTVTDWEAVPPVLVAEHVKVVPVVSVATFDVPHPVVDVTADWASVTVHETDTSLVYHPLLPRVPVTVGVMVGGVVSETISVKAAPVVSQRLPPMPPVTALIVIE